MKPSDRARFEQTGAYPGGKSGSGVYQRLINLMPPHQVYIEPFLGGGAVMRRKRPALINIGLDLDADVISQWTAAAPRDLSAAADTANSAGTRRRPSRSLATANLTASPATPVLPPASGPAARSRGNSSFLMCRRWKARLGKMPRLKKQALLAALSTASESHDSTRSV